jgi:hypothetical protein
MEKKDIINAYCRIRTIDNTIPDDVLDFMKEASIQKLDRMADLTPETRNCNLSEVGVQLPTSKEVDMRNIEALRIKAQNFGTW